MRYDERIRQGLQSIQLPEAEKAKLMTQVEALLSGIHSNAELNALALASSPLQSLFVFLLGLDGADQHAGTLTKLLVQSGSESIRAEAANAIARSRHGKTARLLMTIASTTTDLNVRREAAYGLVGMAAFESQEMLSEFLRVDPDPQIRSLAAEAIGRIALRRNRRSKSFKKAVDDLLLAAEDQDASVRYSAVAALINVKSRRAAPILSRLASSDTGICPDFGSVAELAQQALLTR